MLKDGNYILPYTYNTKNLQEIAEEMIKLPINEHMRIIKLDINDIYVNLPITGIMKHTKFWLNKNYNNKELIEQALHMLNIILQQNYFQYEDQIFQPEKGTAMGSPISSTMAEVYLQYIQETYTKQWLDSEEITYYNIRDMLMTL
jgi:hypothetical protein